MGIDTGALKEGLTKKIGPLPAYAWAGVVVGGIIAWRVLSGRPAFGSGGSGDESIGVGGGMPTGFPTADETPTVKSAEQLGTVGFDPSPGPTYTQDAPIAASNPLTQAIGSALQSVQSFSPSVQSFSPFASAGVSYPSLSTAPLASSPTVAGSLGTAPATSIRAAGTILSSGLIDKTEAAYLSTKNKLPALPAGHSVGGSYSPTGFVPYVSHQNDPAAIAAARKTVKVTPAITAALKRVKATMPRRAAVPAKKPGGGRSLRAL
jgi:hypothetical protein